MEEGGGQEQPAQLAKGLPGIAGHPWHWVDAPSRLCAALCTEDSGFPKS